MASIHKMRRSPFWYGAFVLPNGTRTMRSTGTSNKTLARKICDQWESASRVGKEKRLTEQRSRQVIADIFSIANGDDLPFETLTNFVASWLKKKSLELAESSFSEYQTIANRLITCVGAKANNPIDALTVRDAVKFRDHISNQFGGSTVNKHTKILRGMFADAVKDDLARENIFKRVSLVKTHKIDRRAFTLDELHRILEACSPEWRLMVLLGLYCGQRLGDNASLSWRQIDLQQREIHFTPKKTGKPTVIPICNPLLREIMLQPSSDTPDAPVFPGLATLDTTTVSRQFSEILMEAGLIEARTHQARGIGRGGRRATGGLSYHCLRHTATSLLKNAGVSDVIARSIIGHDSESISRMYTHIEGSSMRAAVDLMPDITKQE